MTRRLSVIKIPRGLHRIDERISLRQWLVPYARLLLERFDETRMFAYVATHPHWHANLRATDESELWCLVSGVGPGPTATSQSTSLILSTTRFAGATCTSELFGS